MAYDPNVIAEQFMEDLAKLKNDMNFLQKMSAKDRKEVIVKMLNKMIDIPAMPEFIEAMFFGFAVNYVEHFVTNQILSKKEK